LPFKDNYFDLIIAENILEHLLNLMPMINEMKRLAKDKIRIGVPNALSINNRIAVLFGRNSQYGNAFSDMFNHRIYFDITRLDQFCKLFFPNFKVVKKEYAYHCKGWFIFCHLTNIYPKLFASEIYYDLEKVNAK